MYNSSDRQALLFFYRGSDVLTTNRDCQIMCKYAIHEYEDLFSRTQIKPPHPQR